MRRHERKLREKEAEEESREETRRRTEEGKGTNAVGGSWRRNDYRPRTYSLPAIISSTNATKSIEFKSPKIFSCADPQLDSNSIHSFTYPMIMYYLNSNVMCPAPSLSISCWQKFRIRTLKNELVISTKVVRNVEWNNAN